METLRIATFSLFLEIFENIFGRYFAGLIAPNLFALYNSPTLLLVALMSSTARTLNINIWGGPGTGKSIVTAQLYAELKLSGISCEMAREYAKELTWAGQIDQYSQLAISAEQHRRQEALQGRADIVVTDAPVPQGSLFAPLSYRKALLDSLVVLTQNWDSLNILIHPNKDVPYEQAGRAESPEMAGMRHTAVTALARSVCSFNLIEVRMPEAVATILPLVAAWRQTWPSVIAG